MHVEYTGRHYEVTSANRKEVESGLSKIRKILRDKFESKVVLAVEKHRHKAEITINSTIGPLVGLAQASKMSTAICAALERLERQALKNKTRIISKKRRNHASDWVASPIQGQPARNSAVAEMPSEPLSIVVHRFPPSAKLSDIHLVRSDEAVATRPMTLEEAIKEAHFRDRDVFVFRDAEGKLMILHRRRDGKMELIEAP
jgi:putative sigma-54 modulation protein